MHTFNDVERAECVSLLRAGLCEDLADDGDVTSNAIIPESMHGSAIIRPRQCGVVAGLPALDLLSALPLPHFTVSRLQDDGPVESGTPVARLEGSLRSILAVERVLLNLLGRLSGAATLTAQYVSKIMGTSARIYDTRKTTPGWRRLEKYAVRIGGGVNHRVGLFDAVLIKDNHLAALRSIATDPIGTAVTAARSMVRAGTPIEVEVDTLTQLEYAFRAAPDVVLLDNMPVEALSIAVELRNLHAAGVPLEASGGITLDNVRAIALTGVERISVGALTHSAPALDLGLDYEPSTRI